MVGNVMSLTNNGLRDWILQRISAVVLAAYFIFIMAYLLCHSGLTYDQWHQLHSHMAMRVATTGTLIALLVHAWIGMWTVLTDYVKPPMLRFTLECLILLTLVSLLIWGIAIAWGA